MIFLGWFVVTIGPWAWQTAPWADKVIVAIFMILTFMGILGAIRGLFQFIIKKLNGE